jgi:ABC-type branched-subunit amino acid transport system substrate-binding protein
MLTAKKLSTWILIAILLFSFSGCNKEKSSWNPISDNTVTIAVIGEEDFFHDSGTYEAAQMASNDFYDKNGIQLKITYFNDEDDYQKAISYAKEIAADDEISAVIVKDLMEYIDTVADIYETAEKPFVITDCCYTHSIENGYKYMLADFITAEDTGAVMANYAQSNGFKRVAFCHSDTEYEKDTLKGFQSKINNSNSVALVDTVIGPYTQEEFDLAYARWLALGVDAVCVSSYDYSSSDIVRMLRQKGSDIQVIADPGMDNDTEINNNLEYLDGTTIVSQYVTGDSTGDIMKRYEEEYGMEMSERAVQSYDIITLLGESLISGVSSPSDVMDILKSEDGYDGIQDTVKFDENGVLITNYDDILVFSDGAFRQKGGDTDG